MNSLTPDPWAAARMAREPQVERIRDLESSLAASRDLLERARAVIGKCIPADHNGYDGDKAKATYDDIDAYLTSTERIQEDEDAA